MKKFPRKIKFETIKALLARSGNQCAFLNCVHPIFNDYNLLVSQLCHIEAISPEGPRYNPNTTSVDVNSYSNLVFLCYRHHKETDDSDIYNIEKLKTIKDEHESKFKESYFKLDDDILKGILKEINDYWNTIEKVNNNEHTARDFKIDIEINANELKLISDIRGQIKNLDLITDILAKDLKTEYFEVVCLALPNAISQLSVLIEQLEIKILELKLINDPAKNSLKDELERLKAKFKVTAKHAGIVD